MLKLIRWLAGFVEFSFAGGFSAGFLNECLKEKIAVSDVNYTKDGITAQCPAFCSSKLKPLAKAHGGDLKIIKKSGVIFRLLPLKNRWGLFVGALAGIVIICALTGFVWNVEITGNSVIPESEVRAILKENGLSEGVMKRSVEKGRLESLILAAFPDCAWAHINEKGTTFTVEIGEGVRNPEVFKSKSYSNLKAKKDGVIVKAVVNTGWQAVKKGEAVTQGDILISGVYESEKKMNLFAHASGEYIARVKEPVKLRVNRSRVRKEYTGENAYKYLYFFGLKIPLFAAFRCDGDTETESSFVYLNSCRLPLGIIKETVKPYIVKTEVLSDKELQKLADKKLEEKLEFEFSDCEIISRKLEKELNEDSITVSGYIICLENIGEEVKIIP